MRNVGSNTHGNNGSFESDKDSLGDDKDSDDTESDGSDETKILDHVSHIWPKNTKSMQNSSSPSLSECETDETDFHPELFGLLDNPGVVRFGDLDYPLTVTE